MQIKKKLAAYLNNFLWFFFLAFLYLIAIVFDQMIFWMLFYFVGLFLIVCFLSILAPFPRIRKDYAEEVIIQAKEPFSLATPLQAKKFSYSFYPHLQGELHLGNGQVSDLINASNTTLNWDLSHLNRGIFTDATAQLAIKDFVGFLRRTTTSTLNLRIIVLPEKKDALASKILTKLMGESTLSSQDNYLKSFQIKALRDYQNGDHYNEIDWKLSAKKQSLMIKEVEQEKKNALIPVFLGLNTPKFEESLATFASFLEIAQNQLTFSGCYLFSDHQLIEDPLFTDFARARPVASEKDTLQTMTNDLQADQKILLFTTHLSDDLSDFLESTPLSIIVILVKDREKIDFYYS